MCATSSTYQGLRGNIVAKPNIFDNKIRSMRSKLLRRNGGLAETFGTTGPETAVPKRGRPRVAAITTWPSLACFHYARELSRKVIFSI